MNRLLSGLLLAALVGCGSSGGKGSNTPMMDPRIADLADWAYACMLDVTGLEPGEMRVPPVTGVNEPWGAAGNVTGMYSWPSRWIQLWITQPYDDLVADLRHEMFHDGGFRLGDRSEDYANWGEVQCNEANRPDIYPAPPIDWNATTRQQSPRPSGAVKPRQGRDQK